MTLETLLKVGKQYPIKEVDELTHSTLYISNLETRKVTGRNEFLLLKQKGKNYEVIFVYNPNNYLK